MPFNVAGPGAPGTPSAIASPAVLGVAPGPASVQSPGDMQFSPGGVANAVLSLSNNGSVSGSNGGSGGLDISAPGTSGGDILVQSSPNNSQHVLFGFTGGMFMTAVRLGADFGATTIGNMLAVNGGFSGPPVVTPFAADGSTNVGIKLTPLGTGHVQVTANDLWIQNGSALDTASGGTLKLGTSNAAAITLGVATTITTGGLTITAGGLTVTAGAVTLPNTSIADAALSANVPLLNAANGFTAKQTVTAATGLAVTQTGGDILTLTGGASGANVVTLTATGADTNVAINAVPKGTGTFQVNGVAVPQVQGAAGDLKPDGVASIGSNLTKFVGDDHAHPDGLGVFTSTDPRTGGAAATWPNANDARYAHSGTGGTCSNAIISVGTASGNISVATYTSSGTGSASVPLARQQTSGAIACPAAGVATIALGGSTSGSQWGIWLGMSCDNTTATFDRMTAQAGGIVAGFTQSQGTAHPLPAAPAGTSGSPYTPVIISS